MSLTNMISDLPVVQLALAIVGIVVFSVVGNFYRNRKVLPKGAKLLPGPRGN